MKTKVKKSMVRDLVLKVREGLGRASGKKLASREATARVLKISPGSLYNWERGISTPTPRLFEELRRAAERPNGKAPTADPATEADRLAAMLRAISGCGDLEAARKTFERAMSVLS